MYDENGNLVTDLNKNVKDLAGAKGIRYNFLDKPEEIHIAGKGTIRLVYDADGNKLQKVYTPENSTTFKTTSYINQFVYEENVLKYINFEEGRIRSIKFTDVSDGTSATVISGGMDLPGDKMGVYDYFIRDYQENVRMILTDEYHFSIGQCSMEPAKATNEEPVFGQPGSLNEVFATRDTKPPLWQSNSSGHVSKLSKTIGKTIGPNSLLKVMAGDDLNAYVEYYYAASVNNTPSNFAGNVVTNLIAAITGSPVTGGVTKDATTAISNDLNNNGAFGSFADPHKNTTDDKPRAYLTVLYFDERFNFVSEGSTFERTDQDGNDADPLTITSKVPKNGYAYIYVSNENNDPVYFDNLSISHVRGRIIEENHYYAFGLKIAGISSRKLGDFNEGMLENKNLYNDKELIDEGDLNWYDLGYRNYDPQTGRFLQIDPLTDHFPDYSPYLFAGNDPIANIDVDGLAPIPGLNGTWATLGDVVVKAAPKVAQVAKTGSTALKLTNIAVKTADIVTDFIPIVSGGKDIYNGIKSGNGWQIALGVGSIALDIFTLGGSSVAKGLVKTAVREGAEMLVKKEVKVIITQGIKKELPKFGCFIKGTPVWTADSTKAIETIRAGDYVYAYDVSKRQVVKKRVTKAYIREVNQLVKIDYGGEAIYTTTEHPFYINNSWVKAGELKAGDPLFVKNGKTKIPVQRITVIDSIVTVYNITVADAHDYYVGRSKVLVHNNPCAQEIKKVAKKLVQELPGLDATGKVHGKLPPIKDLGRYAKDELVQLQKELTQSIRTRIRSNIKHCYDRAHGQRQAAEQQLLKDIETFLKGK